VCVCVCVCLYVWVCVCVCVCVCPYGRVYICKFINLCVYIYRHAYLICPKGPMCTKKNLFNSHDHINTTHVSKRDHLSKETHIHQNHTPKETQICLWRPRYVKRDSNMWKECIKPTSSHTHDAISCLKHLHLSKETYIYQNDLKSSRYVERAL